MLECTSQDYYKSFMEKSYTLTLIALCKVQLLLLLVAAVVIPDKLRQIIVVRVERTLTNWIKLGVSVQLTL